MASGSSKDTKNTPATIEQSPVSKAVQKSYKRYANGFQRPSVLLSLEPRMMFDGAAPTIMDELIDAGSTSSPESLPNPTLDATDNASSTPDNSNVNDASVALDEPSNLVSSADEEDSTLDDLELFSNDEQTLDESGVLSPTTQSDDPADRKSVV